MGLCKHVRRARGFIEIWRLDLHIKVPVIWQTQWLMSKIDTDEAFMDKAKCGELESDEIGTDDMK